MDKHYDENGVLRSLKRNPAIKVFNGCIHIIEGTAFVGNGTWGKIDYLCKVHGYHVSISKNKQAKAEVIEAKEKQDVDNAKPKVKGKAKRMISFAKDIKNIVKKKRINA